VRSLGNPTSISALLRDASERDLNAVLDRARGVEVSRKDAIEALQKMCRSKGWWIQTFSSGPKKRPESDIKAAELQLAVLVQVTDGLRKKEAAHASDSGA
jgi:hypothetical protein